MKGTRAGVEQKVVRRERWMMDWGREWDKRTKLPLNSGVGGCRPWHTTRRCPDWRVPMCMLLAWKSAPVLGCCGMV